MSFNISASYLSKPWTMTCGEWEIVSPPPTVETMKIVSALLAVQAKAADAAENGETLNVDDFAGIIDQSDDELMGMMIGNLDELTAKGCPADVIKHATVCAMQYWAYGGSEAAVQMYLLAIDSVAGEDDPKDELRSQIRQLLGLNTESENPSPTRQMEHPSMKNTSRRPSKQRSKKKRR